MPGTHVLLPQAMGISRRGWPGQARPRGAFAINSPARALSLQVESSFPRKRESRASDVRLLWAPAFAGVTDGWFDLERSCSKLRPVPNRQGRRPIGVELHVEGGQHGRGRR